MILPVWTTDQVGLDNHLASNERHQRHPEWIVIFPNSFLVGIYISMVINQPSFVHHLSLIYQVISTDIPVVRWFLNHEITIIINQGFLAAAQVVLGLDWSWMSGLKRDAVRVPGCL